MKSHQLLANPNKSQQHFEAISLLEREEAEGRRLNSCFFHNFSAIREIDHRILYNLQMI